MTDHDCSSSEASDDDTDPEQSDRPPVSRYVGQTMYGGGLQELLDFLHTIHPCGLFVNETYWVGHWWGPVTHERVNRRR